MQIIVLATDPVWEEFYKATGQHGAEITRVDNREAFARFPDADAWFDLRFDEDAGTKRDFPGIPHPLTFLAAVASDRIPAETIRLNAWPGFLTGETWEAACTDITWRHRAEALVEKLAKTITWVPDAPGMVTPRIISMVINEAYLALEENVSTKEQIDKAMKLGTNYPHGPFEWAEKIGKQKVAALLSVMASQDKKYTPSQKLAAEALS